MGLTPDRSAATPRGPESAGSGDPGAEAEELGLTRLWHAGAALSRNRNFDLYEPRAARRLLRLHRWLRQLERDLRSCATRGDVRLRDESTSARAIVLELTIPSLSFRRTVYLAADELSLLRESEPIAEILRDASR